MRHFSNVWAESAQTRGQLRPRYSIILQGRSTQPTEVKRCHRIRVQCKTAPLLATLNKSLGRKIAQFQERVAGFRDHFRESHGHGLGLGFQAMLHSWTLRMTRFSNLRIMKIRIAGFGK
jgi:hypothetical protein